MAVTKKQIDKALKNAGFIGVEIVKGNGYFYFIGSDKDVASTYTMYYSDLTVEQWVEEYKINYNDAL